MSNTPLNHNEELRVKALKNYHIWNTPEEVDFNNVVQIASLCTDAHIAFISLLDDKKQWLKANLGMPSNEMSKGESICQYTIQSGEPLIIEDIAKDPRLKNRLPANIAHLRFYAGFPLIDPEGFVLGSLCVMDTKPRSLTEKQKEILILLADQTVTRIINRQKRIELAQLEKMFSICTDLIRVCKKDGTIIKMNPALKTILGWELNEVEGKSIFDFMSPEVAAKKRKIFSQLSEKNTVLNITYSTIAKDSSNKILEWVGTYDPSTDLVYSIGRDITKIEEKNEQLSQSEKKFRILFENSPTFMCTHDLKGNFLSVNRAGANSIGYDLNELTKMSLFDIIPQERHPFIYQYLEEIKRRQFLTAPMHTVTKSGERKIWVFNNSLIQNENEEAYVIGNAVDITEMARLQEELTRTSQMLEQTNSIASIGSWEIDLEKKTAYWSSVTKQIYELPQDFVPQVESGLDFFVSAESQNTIRTATKLAIKNGQSYDLTLQIQTAKGKLLWTRIIGKPILGENRRCKKIMGTFQDVNEKEKNAEALRKAKLLAEQASKTKSEFLANMSHEIRTPLNGVIGFTDLVLKTALNETQKKYISIVNESANSLLNIINDILDFSKIEAGKMELVNSECDLFELASQATNIISFQAEKKDLQISLNIGPGLPRYINTDETRLKQILINLLGNAIKFTQKGKIELSISSLEEFKDNTVKMRFEVSDTGIGIHPDKLERIFKAFAQEDSSISKKYGGTGLGLAISNNLLKLMDSRLQLQSELGKGSTFYFDLVVETKTDTPIDFDTATDIKRVLVVDDSENNLTVIKEMLQLKNIETFVAKTGVEALQKLYEGETYDVILVDYFMPIMNGIETIKKIRENFYPTSNEQAIIILYSSHEDEYLQQACEDLGVNNRLLKPVKMTDLYSVFSKLKKNQNATEGIEKLAVKEDTDITKRQVEILIAEDNEINMFLSKTLVSLILPNAFLHEARDGKEAVDKMAQCEPNLVLMDVQMPNMDGLEATQIIRKNEKNKNIPIIALTASNSVGDKEKCLEAGMNDFLTKPIVEKTLKEMLIKWLSRVKSEEKVHVDFNTIHLYALEDKEFEKIFISLIIKSINESSQNLHAQIAKKDLAAIKTSAHKLRGTATTSGLIEITLITSKLEAQDAIEDNTINNLINQLDDEIEIVQEILSTYLKKK